MSTKFKYKMKGSEVEIDGELPFDVKSIDALLKMGFTESTLCEYAKKGIVIKAQTLMRNSAKTPIPTTVKGWVKAIMPNIRKTKAEKQEMEYEEMTDAELQETLRLVNAQQKRRKAK